MPKVSYATSFGVGLVGPKLRAKAVSDGQPVSIPAPPRSRFKATGGRRKVGGAYPLDMVRHQPKAMPGEANPPRIGSEGTERAFSSERAIPLSLHCREKPRVLGTGVSVPQTDSGGRSEIG